MSLFAPLAPLLDPLYAWIFEAAARVGLSGGVAGFLASSLALLLVVGVLAKVAGLAARVMKGLEVVGWAVFVGALAVAGASWGWAAWDSEWGREGRCWAAKRVVDMGLASWVLASWVC